jgi:hypothetical protein
VTSVASLGAAACSTAPAGETLSERTGSKPPRLLHAFPEGSIVALCGAKERSGLNFAGDKPCPRCRDEADRRYWGAR